MQSFAVEFTADFFDGLYYIKNPSKSQVHTWAEARFKYGIYLEGAIPFFVVEFPEQKWSFTIPVNVYDAPEKTRTIYLSGKNSVINLFLINSDSNVIEAVRTFKTDSAFATQLRTACQNQLKLYKNATEVSAAIQKAVQKKNTADMIAATKMQTLITV